MPSPRFRRIATLTLALLAAACTKAVTPPPVVATLPPPPVPMPDGARPGMMIPARLADGRYATPNQALSADAAVWHLRSALNVAALACRGPQEAVLAAGYNNMLSQHSARLKSAQAKLTAEYRAVGTDWQGRYDDAMTRLYNYWAQDFARAGFCAEAEATLAAAAVEPDATFDAFAAARLAALDKPFTDFFAAYDAWRTQTPLSEPQPAPTIALDVAALR